MTTTPDTYTSWRVRDAADNLLARRGLRSTSLLESSSWPLSSEVDDDTCIMDLSKYFDVDICQARLRRDKTPIVKMALDAAATAILENLHKADDDGDYDENDADDNDSLVQQEERKRLPLILNDIVKLQEMRVASMERAHANKDLSKRRIAVAMEQEEERQKIQKNQKQKLQVKKQQSKPKTQTQTADEEKKKINPKSTESTPDNTTSATIVTLSKSNFSDHQDLTMKTPVEEDNIKKEQHKILARPSLVSSSSETITSSNVGSTVNKTTKNDTIATTTTTSITSKNCEKDVIPTKVVSNTTNVTTSKSVKFSSSLSGENKGVTSSTTTLIRKFTRNTPASSSSALEARLTGSRAILCTTANLTFDSLTPPLPELKVLEVADIPQNPKFRTNQQQNTVASNDKNGDSLSAYKDDDEKIDNVQPNTIEPEENDTSIEQNGDKKTCPAVPNMGAVIIEAKALGQRIETIAANAVKRSQRRFRFRKDSILFRNNSLLNNDNNNAKDSGFRILENPFAWKEENDKDGKNKHSVDDDDDESNDEDSRGISAMEMDDSLSVITADATLENNESWEKVCIPRLLSILKTGIGNGIIYDALWSTRHGRIANLFQEISNDNNFGLHLIVTVDPDVDRFTKEFKTIDSHLRLMSTVDEKSLRALPYKGDAKQRRRLRKQFPQATGLSDAPFHVIVTSYTNFLKDYIHFCQTPFEVVLMDDGACWMGAAHNDPNSFIATIWEDALFSKNDHQMGLAGSFLRDWDYDREDFDEETLKEVWVGLTARHRLITSSKLRIENQKSHLDVLPISGILKFVVPHFVEAVREEWERSRIGNDAASLRHFRKLLTRSVVVHAPKVEDQSVYKLSMRTLQGDMEDPIRAKDPKVPICIADEKFISDGKVASSRRSALLWLGPVEDSWLRYELGSIDFEPILTIMKISLNYGHICEEIVTASSATTGATGQIFGNVAYKLAVRCGRSFGSEQGLRQHLSTHHAPPGTWLCRTCKADCVTSQARTHHERYCGQPSDRIGSVTDAPIATSVGVSKQDVGKKKGKALKGGAVIKEEKDADGSIRVPSYRGIWVDQAGKYFVKIKADRVCGDDDVTLTFENIDEAAKKHDELVRCKDKNGKAEYNFKLNGTRTVYEDVSTSSTTSLGGGAQSVVPALSVINIKDLNVINIKDLPPDVKPLLRDPRQTSRTGGNSKRHVYAYRGVCRQARKGHDRWQSQISFLGVNHYLGTFDSEWDAAAIYAWAHLILYGEEATRQAQKEGEEAAAAYEQEKRDIAAGKIPEPPAIPEKQPKKSQKKKNDEKMPDEKNKKDTKKAMVKITKGKPGRPRKRHITEAPVKQSTVKKMKPTTDKESLAPILAKSVGKATILAPVQQFENMSDEELMQEAAIRIVAARNVDYRITEVPLPAPIHIDFRPCVQVPLKLKIEDQIGGAMLVGLNPSVFGWNIDSVVNNQYFVSDIERSNAIAVLTAEFGPDGLNQRFRSLIQGRTTVIGCASSRTQRLYTSLGLGSPPMGGHIGTIDCNTGGNSKSCSETACVIRYVPTENGDFQLSALSSDLITMNGQKITPEMGPFPLVNEDICTIGSRVFVFLLPSDN